jgi:hypothetical protein
MRPGVWQPPVACSRLEQEVIKRIKRARLFVWLREHRHELFDADFQAELAGMYADRPAGQPPVPRAQPGLATILQAYTGEAERGTAGNTPSGRVGLPPRLQSMGAVVVPVYLVPALTAALVLGLAAEGQGPPGLAAGLARHPGGRGHRPDEARRPAYRAGPGHVRGTRSVVQPAIRVEVLRMTDMTDRQAAGEPTLAAPT